MRSCDAQNINIPKAMLIGDCCFQGSSKDMLWFSRRLKQIYIAPNIHLSHLPDTVSQSALRGRSFAEATQSFFLASADLVVQVDTIAEDNRKEYGFCANVILCGINSKQSKQSLTAYYLHPCFHLPKQTGSPPVFFLYVFWDI